MEESASLPPGCIPMASITSPWCTECGNQLCIPQAVTLLGPTDHCAAMSPPTAASWSGRKRAHPGGVRQVAWEGLPACAQHASFKREGYKTDAVQRLFTNKQGILRMLSEISRMVISRRWTTSRWQLSQLSQCLSGCERALRLPPAAVKQRALRQVKLYSTLGVCCWHVGELVAIGSGSLLHSWHLCQLQKHATVICGVLQETSDLDSSEAVTPAAPKPVTAAAEAPAPQAAVQCNITPQGRGPRLAHESFTSYTSCPAAQAPLLPQALIMFASHWWCKRLPVRWRWMSLLMTRARCLMLTSCRILWTPCTGSLLMRTTTQPARCEQFLVHACRWQQPLSCLYLRHTGPLCMPLTAKHSPIFTLDQPSCGKLHRAIRVSELLAHARCCTGTPSGRCQRWMSPSPQLISLSPWARSQAASMA